MSATDRIDDLLSVYLANCDQPGAAAPEQLCRDCPELLPELHKRIAAAAFGAELLKSTGGAIGPDTAAHEGGVPTRLGEYAVRGVLGRGGMGAVLLAEDTKLGRQVAVKVMLAQLAADPTARERFVREARAAAAVHHDHVVPIFHVGEEGGVPFLVMPLLQGESLETRLKRGALTAEGVVRVGREAAEGLAAAHAKGVIHRDVKPANLWLEAPNGRVKLLDFGLARAADGTDALTRPGGVLGTPAYMAPEQAEGTEADGRADLFGLGATLYQAATGVVPFRGATLTAVLRAVAEHHPPAPCEVNPDVPRPLSALILRLLAKKPQDRPPSARAVADELAALAPASPVPTIEYQPVRRNRWPVRVAALVILLGLGLTLWAATRQPGAGPPPPPEPDRPGAARPVNPSPVPLPQPTRYRGSVNVKVERDKRLVKLTEPGALPLVKADKFVIEGTVDPPAYLYLVWVDPNRDVTPVYPWNPEKGWGSRPATEAPLARVRLPGAGQGYTAPRAAPGVATMVLLARPTPLDVPDAVVQKWFEDLPELPLPPGGEGSAVWFDDYVESTDPDRPRTFKQVPVGDPFARWQGLLQKSVGDKASFQTAVSFARTGNTK